MENTRQQVREFYDRIGWSRINEGLYQNARYEDLRPVSREYIHNCHMRINRHIAANGYFFLDAGSGPVQYPEYLTYSSGYRYRVCADLSITALLEARKKIGPRGLYIVTDITHLPFRIDAFDAAISMHTIHHLPLVEHKQAYLEITRVLKPLKTAIIIDGWHEPFLMKLAEPLIRAARWITGRTAKRKKNWAKEEVRAGTFVDKMTPSWLKRELNGKVNYQVFPWRSLSPRFMRWFVRPRFGGKGILRLIFWLEERFPGFFGRHGQYPLIVLWKPEVSL